MRSLKKKLKVLFVYHKGGCNEPYLLDCFKHLSWLSPIRLKTIYLQKYENYNQDPFDVLIYNTFADPTHESLFVPFSDLIAKTDRKFLSFTGTKILFDAHDNGAKDAYERFRSRSILRIKNAPHDDFSKQFSLVSSTTYPIKLLERENQLKDTDISFCVSLNTNPIRKKILSKLQKYAKNKHLILSSKRINSNQEYRRHLSRTVISVAAPGWGDGTFRHLETLNAGTLLFAHSSVEKIKLLPNADLKPGHDYISFDLNNIEEKLNYLLSHPNLIEKISSNGYRKFIKGYSTKETCNKLVTAIFSAHNKNLQFKK